MSSTHARAPRLSFGRQIILLITAAVISLAVVGSITAAYFINDRISNIVLNQGRQITGALAHQSILPLLSGMADTVKEDVNTTLQYPSVNAIIIYDKRGKLLVNTGFQEIHNVGTFPNNASPFDAVLLRETEGAWEFMATVYDIDVTRNDESSLDELFVRTPELIGYVVIQTDKNDLYKIQGELLLDNLYIFLGVGVLMLAISILISQQMTTPLNHLAKLMRKAEEGEEGLRSTANGPVEIHNMARAFNTMMDALEQRQAYLVSLFNNVVDGIVILDEQGLIETVNPPAEKLLQRPVELIQGKDFVELLDTLSSRSGKLAFDLHHLTKTSTSKEHIAINSNGKSIYLDLKFSQMLVKGGNKFIVILIDVTASQQQKNRIESLLLQHETIVSNVPGIIVELDCNNRLVWWNKYTEAVTGRGAHLLQHADFKQLLPGEQQEAITNGLANIRNKGRGELHADIMTPSGPVPYQLNASKMRDKNSNNTSLLVVGLDDSQSILAQNALKEARDAALESARIKSEFLANMSHEIRTPMNGMFGMLQLLSGGRMSEEERGYVDIALRSAEQLLSIIDDILDFSKIEAGKLELEHVEFSPCTIIEDIVELFTPKCQHKKNQISSSINANTPPLIFGDPTKLRQIISNLVNNAIKFTDEGDICVSCRLGNITNESTAKQLIIEVEDTGIGIEVENREKIFNSFVQADGSSTRRYSGTGLGLAIVRQLVDLMDGVIELSSVLGEGSTFRIFLPIEEPKPQPTELLVASTELTLSADSGQKDGVETEKALNILVVEDNKTNQRVITTMLGTLGYQPDIANNGEEALLLLETSRYALIFMDCQMPVMDGYQTTQMIRDMEVNGGIDYHPRIIAMTGNAMEGDREHCVNVGMDDYIAKPIRLSLLKRFFVEVCEIPGETSIFERH